MRTRSGREIARSVQRRLCDGEGELVAVGNTTYSVYPESSDGGLVCRVARTSEQVLGVDAETEVEQYVDIENGAIVLVPIDGGDET